MSGLTKKCPKCGNYIQGQKKESFVKYGAKKVFGGFFGSIVGTVAGLAVDAVSDSVYEYKCPNCGHSWEDDGNFSSQELHEVESDTKLKFSDITLKDVCDNITGYYNNQRYTGYAESNDSKMKIKFINGQPAIFYFYYDNGQLAVEGWNDEKRCYSPDGYPISESEFDKTSFSKKIDKMTDKMVSECKWDYNNIL